jgi:hypothetical protein
MAQENTDKPQGNVPQQPRTSNNFSGGMVKDPLDMFKKNDTYTHARNITTFLPDGQLGGRSSEPANIPSAFVPYTIIGSIFLGDGDWVIFSTNNTISEIGIFSENSNSYSTLMNDAVTIVSINPLTGTFYSGLGFNTSNLITGAARRGYDCGFDVYWSDGGRNPDRMLNTATCPYNTAVNSLVPNPWIQNCTTVSSCITCTNTNKIDIQQLRLAPLYTVPCLKLTRSAGPGQLLNGSYQVCVAYAVNGIKCSDYIAFSDVYSVFSHIGIGGAFTLNISNIDDSTKIRFTEMEVVVISMVNNQIEAKRLGIYSTSQENINIDNIDRTLINIPIEKLPINNPAIVSSDAIFPLSNYLTRVGPKERPDFNYQPLANKIKTYWAAVEYPEDYYQKGGNEYGMNVSYLRGERYALYIRFVYNTGDRSASYHIPPSPVPVPASGATVSAWGGPGAPLVPGSIRTVAYGRTGVYVSTERYPDRDYSPSVWGPLCGQQIMHHVMPDQSLGRKLSHFNPFITPALDEKSTISIIGLYFDNIAPPVDNAGNIIPDIVGYEILRSVRDGHQSILAKGMINNMRTYKTDTDGTEGLFQNYPYNEIPEDNRPDWFLTSKYDNIKKGTAGNGARDQLVGHRDDILTFHSPDTTFSHPYLGPGKLELVMAMAGVSEGIFQAPYRHPMFKVLTDFASWLGSFIGALTTALAAIEAGSLLLGANPPDLVVEATEAIPFKFPLLAQPIPNYLAAGSTNPLVNTTNFTIGTLNLGIIAAYTPLRIAVVREQFLTIIKGLVPSRQYALQYNSFGFYKEPKEVQKSVHDITEYEYIKGQAQSFAGYTVNNLYRNEYVALKLNSNINTRKFDRSRYNMGPVEAIAPPINEWHKSHTLQGGSLTDNIIDSYYGVYRVPLSAQYGQIDSTKQVPIGCVQQITPKAGYTFGPSPVMFGGDTYINRYTEKNPFMFFNDWLVDTPQDFRYDYRDYINVPYPMFWINNDVMNYTLLGESSDNRRLDGPLNLWNLFSFLSPSNDNNGKLFYVNKGYFYLFNNGCRDFFVESSVNVGYRDWEDPIPKRFYDPYASSNDFINSYFRSDIIKSDILYKYDYSLSASKFINQYISWGQCLRRDYNPNLAFTCFAYYPRRVVYSLPQEEEQMQDNWRIFLPNNYKDFNDRVYVIKDLHKTGALFLMENSSPMMFAGVETIASKNATEYTIGTGLLFNQTLQSINNIDDAYEYGSCQSRQGVVNTPHGIFWVSEDTGKIFNLKAGQLTDLGLLDNISYHLYNYLPSFFKKQFPNYPVKDNPVLGIGCHLVYDSSHEILYICKKDFYVGTNANYTNGQWYAGPCPPGSAPAGIDPLTGKPLCVACTSTSPCPGVKINFGDPRYFQDASWTLSFDCVSKTFISWHDWHPSHLIPSKIGFFSANGLSGRLWRHNYDHQRFANFYGKDYPVEIEYYTNTQVIETTLQNIEWLLESYQYAPNGTDKFLNYDGSFDQIMIYNREQNSTLQKMVLKPWNDPYAALQYPQYIGTSRTVLYEKVENKYRINDFYDFTKDRGQFFVTSNQLMINTDPNGYTFSTNPAYFDILKPWNQQKRMRYTGSRIFMRKTNLGKNSLTIKYAMTRNQISPR